MVVLHILVFSIGVLSVAVTLFSAIETLVLPRSAPDQIARTVFQFVRKIFTLILHGARPFEQRDRVMAFFAPVGLLTLLTTWLSFILLGYTGIFWSLGGETWSEAFRLSGSSLLTLGYEASNELIKTIFSFSEATIGLILIALLIAYLPTMYAAFSRREAAVTLLEVRAGNPPSAVEMIQRFHRIHGLDRLSEQWRVWEAWFADIEESHTSLAALVFFRSPQPHHSWVTASGAVLDAASLTRSIVDIPRDPQADLCIRAGYLALRRISDFFGIDYNPDPHFPEDPISISRQEFEIACDQLAAIEVPLITDREQAWRDFAGWRVNYDRVLLALAGLTMAPAAPWSGDRQIVPDQPAIIKRGHVLTDERQNVNY